MFKVVCSFLSFQELVIILRTLILPASIFICNECHNIMWWEGSNNYTVRYDNRKAFPSILLNMKIFQCWRSGLLRCPYLASKELKEITTASLLFINCMLYKQYRESIVKWTSPLQKGLKRGTSTCRLRKLISSASKSKLGSHEGDMVQLKIFFHLLCYINLIWDTALEVFHCRAGALMISIF
jgi:hypothetical protein